MTAFQVAHTPKGYVVYRTEFGIDRRYVDVRFPTPREACRYADTLAATLRLYASPLRASAERSDPRSLTPSGVGQVDRSAESRKRDSGPQGQARG